MDKIEELKAYPLNEAINLIQSFPKLKFNESVDVSINLGVDPKKSDQNVRGSSSLPHGIGKISKVAVLNFFIQEQNINITLSNLVT